MLGYVQFVLVGVVITGPEINLLVKKPPD